MDGVWKGGISDKSNLHEAWAPSGGSRPPLVHDSWSQDWAICPIYIYTECKKREDIFWLETKKDDDAVTLVRLMYLLPKTLEMTFKAW